MFITITVQQNGDSIRANANLIISYFKINESTRLIYVDSSYVDAVETPEEIDELIRIARER